jgi:hypothetical protein
MYNILPLLSIAQAFAWNCLQIIPLVDYARKTGETSSSILNKAKRQSIPAFRERGVWKIGI